MLPPPECKGKGGRSDKKKKQKKKTKREQQQDEEAEGAAAAVDAAQGGGAGAGGLEKTVEELLRDYVPASVEGKRPFYCRVCRFQGGRCVFLGWVSRRISTLMGERRSPGPDSPETPEDRDLKFKPTPIQHTNITNNAAWRIYGRTSTRSCTGWRRPRSGA